LGPSPNLRRDTSDTLATSGYIVEEPDSGDLAQQITVVNTGGQVRTSKNNQPILEQGIDLVIDLVTQGTKEMARKGLKKGVDYVAEKVSKQKRKKAAKPNKSGKVVNQTLQLPVVAYRAPVSKPYATSSAPVSVGATLAGSRTFARRTKSGHIVRGREFLGSAYDTKLVSTWTMCLGAPLTPVSFVDSLLRQYGAMYNYFRWRRLRVHYVTTSPTSTAGSIMLYYNKDRASTFLTQTSTNLMPFVLSDPHTTIGPQWQNLVVDLETDSEWKRLDYGLTDDITHYCAGEIFLLSKTAANSDSPGMLLMEYEIEFKDENLTPRLLLWPQPSINYVPYDLEIPSTTTAGLTATFFLHSGTPAIGVNASSLQAGGIYKVIIDFTNSHPWAASTPSASASTLFRINMGAVTNTLSVIDGTTLYALNSTSNITLYPNAQDAYASNNAVMWNISLTARGSASVMAWFSLIGFLGNRSMNPNM
jgi:hypothetical protein